MPVAISSFSISFFDILYYLHILNFLRNSVSRPKTDSYMKYFHETTQPLSALNKGIIRPAQPSWPNWLSCFLKKSSRGSSAFSSCRSKSPM